MIRNLVTSDSPILYEPTDKFDFSNPPMDPKELAIDLADTMIEHNGIGLAAPQIDVPYSVFVFGDPKNKDSITAMFNPIIVDLSKDVGLDDEGCLSFPSLYIKIKRHNTCRVRFTDMHGDTTTINYGGFTAKIIQHEYDHLQGVVFKKKATRFHMEQARRHQKRLMRIERR